VRGLWWGLLDGMYVLGWYGWVGGGMIGYGLVMGMGCDMMGIMTGTGRKAARMRNGVLGSCWMIIGIPLACICMGFWHEG
jgi:hypothetical protein